MAPLAAERQSVRPTVGLLSMMEELFAKRRARLRWVALVPTSVGCLFAEMAVEDAGVVAALPYIVVVLLSGLYIFRPMFALWAPPFAGFVVYTVLVLIDPILDPGNVSLNEWVIFSILGILPTALLWLARPRSEA